MMEPVQRVPRYELLLKGTQLLLFIYHTILSPKVCYWHEQSVL